jgi:hypothetical protein
LIWVNSFAPLEAKHYEGIKGNQFSMVGSQMNEIQFVEYPTRYIKPNAHQFSMQEPTSKQV